MSYIVVRYAYFSSMSYLKNLHFWT